MCFLIKKFLNKIKVILIMQSHETFILLFMDNILLDILIFLLIRCNNIILFYYVCLDAPNFLSLNFCIFHLLFFFNSLILLFCNLVIHEVNKMNLQPQNQFSVENPIFFSVFTMTCSSMLLFLKLNKISFGIIYVE